MCMVAAPASGQVVGLLHAEVCDGRRTAGLLTRCSQLRRMQHSRVCHACERDVHTGSEWSQGEGHPVPSVCYVSTPLPLDVRSEAGWCCCSRQGTCCRCNAPTPRRRRRFAQGDPAEVCQCLSVTASSCARTVHTVFANNAQIITSPSQTCRQWQQRRGLHTRQVGSTSACM
jgi:hypothetical protein